MPDDRDAKRLQFSLRSLLTITVVVALLSVTYRIAWQVSVLMTAVVLVIGFAVAAWRAIKARSNLVLRITLVLLAVVSWLLLYAASIGPVSRAFGRFPSDRPEWFLSVFYAPVNWLASGEPIHEYMTAWGCWGS